MERHLGIRGESGLGPAARPHRGTIYRGSGSVSVPLCAEECAIFTGWTYHTTELDATTLCYYCSRDGLAQAQGFGEDKNGSEALKSLIAH